MSINPVQKPAAPVTPVLVSWDESDTFAAKSAGKDATNSTIRSVWRGSSPQTPEKGN
ncbi:Uncharacterised protein [Mycobacteroides abscessus subsp. abscessus]|uniref:hypothetical protein n=1 Tax=Mycobacteroides abscessus TaxID=36809 RepID=UPI000928CAED|nr:hypothetical protein [Mycobacteroides abscessus]MDM2175306.1 hypothetical protein [Mycobacteroides abscessus]MDM2176308.1 hypothetical protein [Mycobacteroides abscessus]MDM2204873.1 hypothetical protein [Mycobacteroides abscessus]MDM2210458.1 hypothetical protein [Mycobacteroides abscessus]MDM2215792.1 hypothetical protein [Mycobacteroides abscessus]